MDIKLSDKEKKFINSPDDVFDIMQRILLRENKIDKEKEHLWIIGMNLAGYILYIELIALGTVRSVPIEPMNVFRVAVMKNATQIVAVHNHPSGRLQPSDEDKDVTDRLLQVGKILNISLEDHLIITPFSYLSFKAIGLMDEIKKSLIYVPSYKMSETIRQQEQEIKENAKQMDELMREKLESEQRLLAAIDFLLSKNMPNEDIAKILSITAKELKALLKKRQLS